MICYNYYVHWQMYRSFSVDFSSPWTTFVFLSWLCAWAGAVGRSIQLLLFGELHQSEIDKLVEKFAQGQYQYWPKWILHRGPHFSISGPLVILSLLINIFHDILKVRYDHIFITAESPSAIGRTRYVFVIAVFAYVDYKMTCWCFDASSQYEHWDNIFFAQAFEFAMNEVDLVVLSARIIFQIKEKVFTIEHSDEPHMPEMVVYTKVFLIVSSLIKTMAMALLHGVFKYEELSELYYHSLMGYHMRDALKTLAALTTYRFDLSITESCLTPATENEIRSADATCVVCFDEIISSKTVSDIFTKPTKLSCDHIFHRGCVKKWLDKSPKCPTCSHSIFKGVPVKNADIKEHVHVNDETFGDDSGNSYGEVSDVGDFVDSRDIV